MSSVEKLISRWQRRSARLREWTGGDERAATIWEKATQELEETLRDAENEVLNLQQAAELSGYSAGHLSRLIRRGDIPNAGRKYSPKIRRRDLPTKPGHLPQSMGPPHVAEAEAEQIVEAIVAEGMEEHDG